MAKSLMEVLEEDEQREAQQQQAMMQMFAAVHGHAAAPTFPAPPGCRPPMMRPMLARPQMPQQGMIAMPQQGMMVPGSHGMMMPPGHGGLMPPPAPASGVIGRQRCHVHVAMLSFQPERSTKGFPYRCTCKDLLDEYLVHGFLTEAEPLLLWGSPDDKQLRQEDFQCRYVKGMARCSTLLWLLASMADLKIEIMAHFPHLYQTIQVIHGLFECHPDLTSVAIANAHYSNRGSIRAPHDVLTWVTKLMLLDNAGAGKTPSQILEAYNQNASAKGKVNGQRRVSAMTLLQGACRRGVENMLTLLSKLGNKAVWWNEESFCNKKIVPGFAPRTNLRQWNQILTVTETSFCVFVESLNVQQLSKSSRSRKPLDKGRLEEHAQMCSFWCWATQGAMEHAVDQEKLDSLTEKFKTGDVAMTLDVQSLLHERKHDIQWSDVFLACKNDVFYFLVTLTI